MNSNAGDPGLLDGEPDLFCFRGYFEFRDRNLKSNYTDSLVVTNELTLLFASWSRRLSPSRNSKAGPGL